MEMPEINGQNLKWARETAALSREEAARRLGFKGASAAGTLERLESGERIPTSSHLQKMAKIYNRPLLALYVAAPPHEGQEPHDLRTLKDQDSEPEAKLKAIIRDAHMRQSLLRNALEDNDEGEPIAWVGSVSAQIGSRQIAEAIVEAAGFSRTEFRAQHTVTEAFATAREAVESLGIYVLLIGDLGHYSQKVSSQVFRGMSLPDPIAPFIIINDNDSKSAWTFTLFHELTHISIGKSAISGYSSDSDEERLCDETASYILLSDRDLRSLPAATTILEHVAVISAAAKRWKLSRKMVAFNLLRINRIQPQTYEALARQFDDDRLEYPARREGGGGDYYVLRAHRLGRALIRTVNRMVSSGALTAPKAATVLGIRPTAVSHLAEVAR